MMAIHITSIQNFYAEHRVFLIAGGVAIIPVRGAALPLIMRLTDAWRVLTGQYDALSWDYTKPDYNQGDMK